MSTIKVNAIQHTTSNVSNMTLFANGGIAFANSITIANNVTVTGKINANNTTSVDNVAVSSTSTNSYITVTSTAGGGSMMMQAFQGTLGTLGSTNNIPVELITNSVRRMYIDTSGYITKPNQPMVTAARVSSHVQASASPIVFETIVDQTGSSYNSSTGIFTAPVSGWYYLSHWFIWWNMGAASYTWAYKNGSNYATTSLGSYGSFTGSYAGQSGSIMVKASQNDTLGIGFTYNGTNIHSGYAGMSIGLIC
jgi:C1q domain